MWAKSVTNPEVKTTDDLLLYILNQEYTRLSKNKNESREQKSDPYQKVIGLGR